MMAGDPVDVAVFRELEANVGEEFVGELLATFFGEAADMTGDLRAAAASGDAERFRRTAHSLKSNANTFGARTLAEQARALELGGIDADQGRRDAALEALDAALAEARTALEGLRDG